MMLFRSLFILGTQASLFALSSLPSTASASPVPMPVPEPQNFGLHVMVADIPTSLLPTTTEGVTIQRPSGTDLGNDVALATSEPAEASATDSAPDSSSTDTDSTSPPQSNGALSAFASNRGAALGASAFALAFLAL